MCTIQGCTKRWTSGSVNMKRKNCVLLPAVGKQNATLSPNFTQPGAHILGHPCISGFLHMLALLSCSQSERCCGQKCRAGENRSQISRMALWPHRHSCSGGKQSGSGWDGKQVEEGEEGNGTLHILLICDLFPPALQFLSTAALTLI